MSADTRGVQCFRTVSCKLKVDNNSLLRLAAMLESGYRCKNSTFQAVSSDKFVSESDTNVNHTIFVQKFREKIIFCFSALLSGANPKGEKYGTDSGKKLHLVDSFQ